MADRVNSGRPPRVSPSWWWFSGILLVSASIAAYLRFGREPEIRLPDLDPSIGFLAAWEEGDWTLDEETRQRLLQIPLEFRSISDHWSDAHAVSVYGPAKKRPMIPELAARPGQKVVVTAEEFKQMFSAYSSNYPIFVTSDSVLNAFHILFEDSLITLEHANAQRLRELLTKTRKRLQNRAIDANTPLEKSARDRAAIVLGVAHRLVDAQAAREAEADLHTVITEEVGAVRAATGIRKPGWLGSSETSFVGLDYGQYRPVAFYASSSTLADYYRAARWLQSIPFRIDRDVELLSFLMIAEAVRDADREGWATLSGVYREFFGGQDDWDILRGLESVDESPFSVDRLSELQQSLLDRASAEQPRRINDLLRYPPAAGDDRYAFRVLSGFRLPDAVLLQQVSASGSRLPTGLAVSAALGDKLAVQHIPEPDRERWMEVIDSNEDLLVGDSIYHEYLNCLRALFEPAPAGAPEFLASEPWQAKSRQTLLASWAQMRHTTALQSKTSMEYLNGDEATVRGFIEPNPDFFRRLAALSTRIREVLITKRASDSNAAYTTRRLESLILKAHFLATVVRTHEGWFDPPPDVPQSDHDFIMMTYGELLVILPRVNRVGAPLSAHVGRLSAFVQLQEMVQDGRLLESRWKRLSQKLQMPTDELWGRMTDLCEKLAKYSQQQLDGEPFDREVNLFLAGYGDRLAELQLYGEHAGWHPHDDALRITNIFTAPLPDVRRLHVGVGRPRAIYVLYPYRDEEILCRGAVMPYYEFPHPGPLTDAQWRKMYNSPDRPPLPDWLQELYAEE